MYTYRIFLDHYGYTMQTMDRFNNLFSKIYNDKYIQLLGFVKNQKIISYFDLDEIEDLSTFKNYNPVCVTNNGNIKILSYKIKEVKRLNL